MTAFQMTLDAKNVRMRCWSTKQFVGGHIDNDTVLGVNVKLLDSLTIRPWSGTISEVLARPAACPGISKCQGHTTTTQLFVTMCKSY